MKLLTERHRVRDVAERFKSTYCRAGHWGITISGDTEPVYRRLAALDPETATAKDVVAIIGNDTWAGPEGCDECGEIAARAVQLGQEPDYESNTATICEDCLRKALAMLEAS